LALQLAVSPSSVRQRTDTYAPDDDARKTTKALRDAAQAAPDYHGPMDFPHAHGINLYRHCQRPGYWQRTPAS